jgi:hypothetical protein
MYFHATRAYKKKGTLSLKQAMEDHRDAGHLLESRQSRQSAHRWRGGCQLYVPAALYPPGRFLVLISVRG